MSTFPTVRMRRTRQNEQFRGLIRETHLNVEQLIYPLFIAEDLAEPRPIAAMPGIVQWSLEHLGREMEHIAALGIPAVLLFGIPTQKDEVGSQAYAEQGIIQQAIRRIKAETPGVLVVTDVCLCEYTSHGHCCDPQRQRAERRVPEAAGRDGSVARRSRGGHGRAF